MKLVLNHFFLSLQWAFLLAGAVSTDGAASTQLRRSSPALLATEAKQPAAMIPGVTPDEKKKKHDKRVMDAISKFRAEICYKMRKEHGKEFASYEACEKFMTDACHPGKDDKMDGDRREVTSGEGFCEEYFPQARKKAEEIVTHEEELEEQASHVAPAPSPFPFPAPAPAPAPAKKEAAPAPAPAKPAAAAPAGAAPAPGPMGMPVPAPAPVPAPFIPGVSAGKPWGPIGDDEKYYYKKGGKHNDRLHMKEDLKLPTQGYWGKLVEHEDMKTVNADWGREFGPMAGHESYRSICAKNPDNPWCYEQGFGRHRRSSSPAMALPVLSFVCALIATRVF